MKISPLKAHLRTTCLGSLILATSLLASAGCMSSPEPDGTFLSFLLGRKLWQTDQVTVTVTDTASAETASPNAILDGATSDASSEKAISLVALNEATGETLTFLVLANQLEGTHPVRVFGNLADVDANQSHDRLMPISNACTPGDRSLTTGSISFETHDPIARTLSGSFITNVCRVDNADRAWTLADGKFRQLRY